MTFAAKIIAVILAALVISKTYHDYKTKREVLPTFLFWTLTWLSIVFLAFNPAMVMQISQAIDARAGYGTFFGIAFIFLFYITYRVYIKANRLEQKIKEIVMKIGIKDIDNKDLNP